MRRTVVSGAMIAAVLVGAAAPAWADDAARNHALYQLGEALTGAWSKDEATKSWQVSGAAFELGKARCEAPLVELTKMGAPGSSKVKVGTAGPDLAAGEHTLDDARAACGRIVRAGYIRDWEHWAIFAMQDAPKIGKGYVNLQYFENCIAGYDKMLSKGITKDTKVTAQQIQDQKWEGTVEELRKKYCDAGLKAAKAEQDKKDAPYKKAMTGEKLQMALTYRGVWLAGGQVTDEPAAMAKANVWFVDTEPPALCKTGAQQHVLKRFEFAGDKLAKTTDINTCGSPRAKDFK
jgi:hypothetical protein